MRPLRSSPVLGAAPINHPTPTADRDRTVSRRSKPSSRTTLNGEQPYPLGPTSAPGCDEPTSRCQTPPSIWTLGRYQPVIPGVPFIRWAMALPFRTTGSLWPTFVPARLVCLAVKLAYTIALTSRCPTVISKPSCSSVTLWEETAPVKLPTRHCPRPRFVIFVRTSNVKGWYFKVASTMTGVTASKAPTYPTHQKFNVQCQAIVKVHGVFPSSRGYTASSRRFQFHWVSGGDSLAIIMPFVQVGTYPTRNFATLGPL